MQNKTQTLVPLPSAHHAVGCKWVFKIKKNSDSSVSRYKAWLVAKGCHQRAGIDFSKTFSPVVKPTTIPIVLTVALAKGWPDRQLDINHAFRNEILKENIYKAQPPGFQEPDTSSLVCKLNKAIYGLKQVPRAWFDRSHEFLTSGGFILQRQTTLSFSNLQTRLLRLF